MLGEKLQKFLSCFPVKILSANFAKQTLRFVRLRRTAKNKYKRFYIPEKKEEKELLKILKSWDSFE